MKGKQPKSVNKLRNDILADESQFSPYFEQRLISQLGGLIDRALTEQHLTQTRLAETVQMHQPDLSALIRGRAEHLPTLPTLRKLSVGLGVGFSIRIDPSGAIELTETESRTAEQAAHFQTFEAAG